jgi:citrate lyase beta subunit
VTIPLFLFTPAHETRKVASAFRSGAPAIILDLEDAVPEGSKAEARASIGRLDSLKQASPSVEVWVRINSAGRDFADDLEGIDWSVVSGAVLPKTEDKAQIESLAKAGVRRAILLVESAAGFHMIAHLERPHPIVERLGIGTWDLALDLRLFAVNDPDEAELLWQLRGDMVIESRRLRLKSPIDGIYGDITDDSGLRERCIRAHRLGFAGKMLIHPRQIEVVRSVFAPDATALRQAREVIDTYSRAVAGGQGAISVNGRLVDRVMVERAKALLTRATTEGLIEDQ